MKNIALILLGLTFFRISLVCAEEGLFTTEQFANVVGSSLPLLDDLTISAMVPAMVDLDNCSGAFVSKQGLVVTNHHCVSGTLQHHSTINNNYLENGFLANTFVEELPAAPSTSLLITQAVSDVTAQVLGSTDELSGVQRPSKITENIKALISDCEQEQGYRCKVSVFNEGLQYSLIKQLEINDVRLVYAPKKAIGNFGGEADKWEWPRHTGDFAFYRAYVDKQGRAASYSQDNVPYVPEQVFRVSAKSLKEGDVVMTLGFPNRTQRYTRSAELDYVFNWLYPMYIDLVSGWIEVIERSAERGSEARLKYQLRLTGLKNFLKSTQAQLAGARRTDLVRQRKAQEALLEPSRSFKLLDSIQQQQIELRKQRVLYRNATRSALLNMAQTLYSYAVEQQKPDSMRNLGFQARDKERLFQQMTNFDKRFDVNVDKAQWTFLIEQYRTFPETLRVDAFERALTASGPQFSSLSVKLEDFYKRTQLLNIDKRLALLDATPQQLEASEDPFIQMAIALYNSELRMQQEQDKLEAQVLPLKTVHMQSVIAWRSSQGKVVYPDANGTLRFSVGEVKGGSPRDGLIYEPFTRLEGIVEKHTGRAPFNADNEQLSLIREGIYGDYLDPQLATVAVNFLSDVDSAGGSSGSVTVNDNGELVGLLFDSTFESVNAKWSFDAQTTRAIHVDSRYMLWVMQYVDKATRLINEMDLVKDTPTTGLNEEQSSASEQ